MNYKSTILVVDDEPDSFDVIEGILFKEGYDLNYNASGISALQRLEIAVPDLILLDVMMPELNGLEVCRRIKNQLKLAHIPIIMITALNSKEDLSNCLDAGADDFISKPVSAIELRARVRSMLRLKKQSDALIFSQQQLAEALQLREDMSYMLVHDLRNPIMAIGLACQIMKRTSLDPKQDAKVNQIITAAQRLESLADSLLMIAKIEAGKLSINRELVSLENLVQVVANNFSHIASQKEIEIIEQFAKPARRSWLDDSLISRVLENLLSNAIKFSEPKTEIKIAIDYPTNNTARIKVIDTGPGVSDAIKKIIFQKYEVGKLIKNVSQTGLGLAFCKMAIEAHQGTISVTDNYPKGSIFTVILRIQNEMDEDILNSN